MHEGIGNCDHTIASNTLELHLLGLASSFRSCGKNNTDVGPTYNQTNRKRRAMLRDLIIIIIIIIITITIISMV